MCDEPAELQVQCAMLEGLLLMMPLTADAAGVGTSRDPTEALVRTLYPAVLRVRPHCWRRALGNTTGQTCNSALCRPCLEYGRMDIRTNYRKCPADENA